MSRTGLYAHFRTRVAIAIRKWSFPTTTIIRTASQKEPGTNLLPRLKPRKLFCHQITPRGAIYPQKIAVRWTLKLLHQQLFEYNHHKILFDFCQPHLVRYFLRKFVYFEHKELNRMHSHIDYFFRENDSSQKPSAQSVERDREICSTASTAKLDCRILQKPSTSKNLRKRM